METTPGTLLGGRVAYAQPRDGYRTGIEPVLMAAMVPAQAGEVVLEAGCGAGAALLCVLARVPGVRGVGVELDPGMAALARANAAANGVAMEVVAGDVAGVVGPVDHAMANPPWHDAGGTAPSGALRVLAKQRGVGGLGGWIGPLAAALGVRGTLTLALPAAALGEAMALLHGAGLGRVAVLPLWPRAGCAARLVLVQAGRVQAGRVNAGRGAGCRLGAGLVLHEAGGGYTAAAEAVLRGGQGLTA